MAQKKNGARVTCHVVKSSAMQIEKGIGLGFLNHCVEALVREHMITACRSVCGKLTAVRMK